ncbi:CoA transferase [Bradyrhizobium sp. BR 1432]|uniref:CoA transferase n=1 Tax=Bradyrhizobium sp. BR 1432 TaxID=3447966 RepID=UPI003EE63B61
MPRVDLSRSKLVQPRRALCGISATDSIVRALAGLIKLVGSVEGPPLLAPDFQTGILAGLWGFIAAASSAFARMQGGAGRSWSLSIFESSLTLSEYLNVRSVCARERDAPDWH